VTKPSPLIGTIVLAGVGLIGGSVGLGIRQRFLAHKVIGFDRDQQTLETAISLGIIDEAHTIPGNWLKHADLVILSSPVRSLVPLGLELANYLKKDCLITDVGSVKEEVVEGLCNLQFVGGHPMAGSERNGVNHADASLLENAVWVLTPTSATNQVALQQIEYFVRHLGAQPLHMDPKKHDRLVASVSHLPYLAAVALTELISNDQDKDLMMLLAAGGFRDLTRVASGNPQMSRDMVVANGTALKQSLHRFATQLQRLSDNLDRPAEFLERATRAKNIRDEIPVVRRSLLPARFEVVLALPDRPGQLALVTQAIGNANVNICDIEVLSIREAGGALRIAFDDHAGMHQGTKALQDAGYEVIIQGES
jgi:prephenate dehydrogenase